MFENQLNILIILFKALQSYTFFQYIIEKSELFLLNNQKIRGKFMDELHHTFILSYSPIGESLLPSSLLLQPSLCFLQVIGGVDTNGFLMGDANFDTVSVLEPAQLLKALCQL